MPADRPIQAGVVHRARRILVVQVHDYDDASITTKLLEAGSVFQPWEPLGHWRGERVPITLGAGAAGFDWGVTSREGHFLAWDDFLNLCSPVGEEDGTMTTSAPNERQPDPPVSPFDEIRILRASLRARARRSMRGESMVETLLAVMDQIEGAHRTAVEMQLGAEGHDNMDSVRYWSGVAEGLEAAAREIARACKIPPALRAGGGEF